MDLASSYELIFEFERILEQIRGTLLEVWTLKAPISFALMPPAIARRRIAFCDQAAQKKDAVNEHIRLIHFQLVNVSSSITKLSLE